MFEEMTCDALSTMGGTDSKGGEISLSVGGVACGRVACGRGWE